jgi:hypothetical protein
MLEKAAVHQHQVVTGPGAVEESCRARPSGVKQAAGVQGHAAAAAATAGERATDVVGECLHHLGTPGRLLGFDRRVHPSLVHGWYEPQLRLAECL